MTVVVERDSLEVVGGEKLAQSLGQHDDAELLALRPRAPASPDDHVDQLARRS